MKIAIAVYVICLSFAFQHESVFANKVPTPERLRINNLPPLSGRGPIRVRPVPGGQERLSEAVKHGFKKAIVPKGNLPKTRIDGLELIGVTKLEQALDAI